MCDGSSRKTTEKDNPQAITGVDTVECAVDPHAVGESSDTSSAPMSNDDHEAKKTPLADCLTEKRTSEVAEGNHLTPKQFPSHEELPTADSSLAPTHAAPVASPAPPSSISPAPIITNFLSNIPIANKAPSPPRWRFTRVAKKSLGYDSYAAGTIVNGKSADELGAKYFPPQINDDGAAQTERSVGKLNVREWHGEEEEFLEGEFPGFSKKSQEEEALVSSEEGGFSNLTRKWSSQHLEENEDAVDEEKPADLPNTDEENQPKEVEAKILDNEVDMTHGDDIDDIKSDSNVSIVSDAALEAAESLPAVETTFTQEKEARNAQPTQVLEALDEEIEQKPKNDEEAIICQDYVDKPPQQKNHQSRRPCYLLILLLPLLIVAVVLGVLFGTKPSAEVSSARSFGTVGGISDPTIVPSSIPSANPSTSPTTVPSQIPSSTPSLECPVGMASFSLDHNVYFDVDAQTGPIMRTFENITWFVRDACSGEVLMQCLPCSTSTSPPLTYLSFDDTEPSPSSSSQTTILPTSNANMAPSSTLPKPIRPGYTDKITTSTSAPTSDATSTTMPKPIRPGYNVRNVFSDGNGGSMGGDGNFSLAPSSTEIQHLFFSPDGAFTIDNNVSEETGLESVTVKENSIPPLQSTSMCLPTSNEYVFEVTKSSGIGSCCGFDIETFVAKFDDVVVMEGEEIELNYGTQYSSNNVTNASNEIKASVARFDFLKEFSKKTYFGERSEPCSSVSPSENPSSVPSSTPTTSPPTQSPVVFKGGCPEEFIPLWKGYNIGSRVEFEGIIYECTDYTCGLSGYEPGSKESSLWRQSWDIVGSCLGTIEPTFSPSRSPTVFPSEFPSMLPSLPPSLYPSFAPSLKPSLHPSSSPTTHPSFRPSGPPSSIPSPQPSLDPSASPSHVPSEHPSSHPTSHPSSTPSIRPSFSPSIGISQQPSSTPTITPSSTPPQPVISSLPCTPNDDDFNLCIAIDTSGSVCNQGTGFECEGCQPAEVCNPDNVGQSTCCSNFVDVVDFARLMITTLGFFSSEQSYSLVQFATNANIISGLTSPLNAIESLEGMKFSGGRTNHAEAITLCQQTLSLSGNGRKNLMLFITDGNPSEPSDSPDEAAQIAAQSAKLDGTFIIPVLIIPVLLSDSIAYMSTISSDGQVFDATDFEGLANLQQSLLTKVSCQA